MRRWPLWLASLLHRDSESLEIETLVLGHSLACFARVLHCACSFICSLFFTPKLVGQMNFNVLFSWCSQSLCVGWFVALLLQEFVQPVFFITALDMSPVMHSVASGCILPQFRSLRLRRRSQMNFSASNSQKEKKGKKIFFRE